MLTRSHAKYKNNRKDQGPRRPSDAVVVEFTKMAIERQTKQLERKPLPRDDGHR